MPQQPKETATLSTSPPKANAIALLVSLAFTGGYADAASYVLAGSFTGHITGNTVLGAISFARGDFRMFGLHAAAVAVFLTATCAGALLSTKQVEAVRLTGAILCAECLLVAFAAVGAERSWSHSRLCMIVCLCLALGLQNGTFHRSAGVSLHTTYITGNVTNLAISLFGKKESVAPVPVRSNPSPAKILIITWLTFALGAIVSGVAAKYYGPRAIWLLELPLFSAFLLTNHNPL